MSDTQAIADLRTQDFEYPLPLANIAQEPLAERSAARMLVLPTEGSLRDAWVRDLPTLVAPGDLLVLNDTRVMRARLMGQRASGGRIELLVERVLDERSALCQLRCANRLREGIEMDLEGGGHARTGPAVEAFWSVNFDLPCSLPDYLEQFGHLPLPPYIQRDAEAADLALDRERYQTVYARNMGAVAAPTAGLHFDANLLQAVQAAGVECAHITLHVGAGTFQPVRVDNLDAHRMHAEWLCVDEAVVDAVARTRARGGRVLAVGTTVVRALESAAGDGELRAFQGESRLFIRPGYRFRVVDRILTNFHLPGSTLLMLVSAFVGRRRVLAAYAHAVEQGYRFFSYGDAMWLEPHAEGLDAV